MWEKMINMKWGNIFLEMLTILHIIIVKFSSVFFSEKKGYFHKKDLNINQITLPTAPNLLFLLYSSTLIAFENWQNMRHAWKQNKSVFFSLTYVWHDVTFSSENSLHSSCCFIRDLLRKIWNLCSDI